MIRYIRQYARTSSAQKVFLWTVFCFAAILIISTVWVYARLSYARTNIPNPPVDFTHEVDPALGE